MTTPATAPREALPVYFASMNAGMSPMALWSLNRLGTFAQESGCNGVDLAPAFDTLPGHTPTAARAAIKSGDLILGGLHTAVRGSGGGGENDGGYKPTGLKVMAGKLLLGTPVVSRIVMPTAEDAAPILARYQMAADTQLPICWFPLKDAARDQRMRDRANGSLNLLQLKDDAAGTIGATNPAEFEKILLNDRGYDGFILDTTHAANVQEYGKGVISNVDASVPALAPHVRAVHLSLGRSDLGGEAAKASREDGVQLIRNGKFVGKTAEMLTEVIRNGQVEYAVIEATVGDMKSMITEAMPGVANPTEKDVQGAYYAIGDLLCSHLGRGRITV